jgi:hypothetical protein
MSQYLVIRNETGDWLKPEVLGIYTGLDKVVDGLLTGLSKYYKKLIISYCKGYIDSDHGSNDELGDNIATHMLTNEDYYSYTIMKLEPNEAVNFAIMWFDEAREMHKPDALFHGTFKELYEYVEKSGVDMSQWPAYGIDKETFEDIMESVPTEDDEYLCSGKMVNGQPCIMLVTRLGGMCQRHR